MNKIVIIGAGEFQNPLILKAKEMGYETHVFAWKSGDIGEKTADYFYPISIIEKEKILEISKKIDPCAVVSIGSDLATITVNYVARHLGLVCNPSESDYCSTNKYIMRKRLKSAGLKTPKFVSVNQKTEIKKVVEGFSYPLIVKPTDRSGSRGITEVNKSEELEVAVSRAIEESFEKCAIIEEFIQGEEYSCECISYRGKHIFLSITKKYTTGFPHYIERGHIQPAVFSEDIKNKIKAEVFCALDALDVKYGASHSEFRVDSEGNVRIIEIGARMGGDCIGSDLVQISTGTDYMKQTIQVALGNEPEVCKNDTKVAVIRFIFNERDKEILEEVSRKEEVVCIRKEVKPILNRKVTDSSTRYGFYIFECTEQSTAQEIMNEK